MMSNELLHSFEVQIIQMPSKDNGHHAVCNTRAIFPSGQKFMAIGEAVGSSENDLPAQGLLQQAAEDGRKRAMEFAAVHAAPATALLGRVGSAARGMIDVAPAAVSSAVLPQSAASGKPISDKQKRLIETTAMYNKKNLDDAESAAQALYGRSIAELTTMEVTPILNALKGKE